MKKIIFYNPSFETGGVENNIKKYFNILNNKKDFEIIIISTDYKTIKKKIGNVNIVPNYHFTLKGRLLKYIVSFFFLLKKCFFKKTIIFSFQNNILAIIAGFITNNSVIIRLNTAPDKYIRSTFFKLIFKIFYSRAKKIVVNDEDFRFRVKKIFKLNSHVVHNSIDINNVKKKSKSTEVDTFINSSSLNLVSVGRLTKQKDHITILKAVNLIKEKIKVRLLIIGSGKEEKNLTDFIKENNLKKIVKMKNFTINPYPHIRKADIFILSSLYEGSPNVLLEAGALNTLIISSNCDTGPRQILSYGKGGHLFKIRDFKKLSKIILETDHRNSKSKKMKKILTKKIKLYNFENQKKELIKILKDV
jgi:glycosyltransferase involved in cell wall biosynthesis